MGYSYDLVKENLQFWATFKGMFNQLRVRHDDINALWSLWRSTTLTRPSEIYERQQKKGDFPGFVEKVERNCYMDNYMDSFETELEEESIEFRTKIQEGLRKGSKDFLFTQWMSLSRLVLN